MTAPAPGRLTARRLTALRPGRRHRPAPPAPERSTRFVPVRLTLPPDVGKGELALIWRNTDVVFDVDDSGSMYGTYGDERGVRYAAARSIVDFMVRAGGGRAGVVHWGSSAPAELALPPVDVRRRRRRLERALTIPDTLGGTNVLTGLTRTRELLAGVDPGRHQEVLVLTDGLEDIGPQLLPAIAALHPASVHLLLVDRLQACTPDLEAAWRSLQLASFTRLAVNDPAQLSWQVADVLLRSRGLTLPPLSASQKRRFPK